MVMSHSRVICQLYLATHLGGIYTVFSILWTHSLWAGVLKSRVAVEGRLTSPTHAKWRHESPREYSEIKYETRMPPSGGNFKSVIEIVLTLKAAN